MIKSSLEPALRAGFQRGGFSKIFDSRGGLGIPPFSHPWITQTYSIHFNQGWIKSVILGRGSSYKDLIFFGLKSRGGVVTYRNFDISFI